MICPTCSDARITDGPLPHACPTCRGSGRDQPAANPIAALRTVADSAARSAAQIAGLDDEEIVALHWYAARLYYAAASLHVQRTLARAELAALAYRSAELIGRRDLARAMLRALGYHRDGSESYMDADALAALAEMPGGVQ